MEMIKQTFIDLHMHTFYSNDGDFAPSNLVELCHQAGIKIMAITDHNSVKGIDEASAKAKELGIILIKGIEIDCTADDLNLHVLGYGIDHNDPVFAKLEDNILTQELSCSLKKLELTNALGFDLDPAQLIELSPNGVYTGEMFAEVLLNDPRYLDHPLLKPYRDEGSRSANPYVNFYWDYYAQGKACYTPIHYPSLEETLSIIRNHKGVAVLAHPGNNLKDHFERVDALIRSGIQGIEAFSSYHAKETNDYFYQKAVSAHLLVTCGSDFHGKTKPAIRLNNTGCDVDQQAIVDQLKAFALI